LGDTPLILAQRLCAWCGHAPELEIDLALANIGLDLLGQARNFLAYAAELSGPQHSEDSLAFGRDERQFRNVLLVEQPNGSFADTIARQYLMDAWNVALYERLTQSSDGQLAAIAAKAIKEARYHLRFSRGWLVRLGDGTETSAQKMQQAMQDIKDHLPKDIETVDEPQLKAMFASIDKLVTSALSSSSGGAAVGQSMMKYFQDEELKAVPSLIDDTAQIYAEHLTTRELSDMLAWSRSPSAQSIREKLPAISSEAMQRQQPLIKKLMAGAMKTAVDRACEENPCTADQRQTMAMMLERFAPAS
jgi:ring-1,2-phenylacetyl-CoA epoxidase subunit PaaC